MRSLLPIILALSFPAVSFAQEPASQGIAEPAQEAVPTGLARVERERSRQCVAVLDRIHALEAELEPLANRSQRLMVVGRAIALEDPAEAAPFDEADKTEAAVAAWFERDAELAQRYLDAQDEAVAAERAAAREEIKNVVNQALSAVQIDAETRIASAGDLTTSVGGCEGAVLIRPAVLEACAGASSPVCDAAAAVTEQRGAFRFVDSPENLWGIQEIRPWTSPSPLTLTPDGQIGGARTLAYARNGNLTLTLAFAPLLADRTSFTPEQLERFQAINDSAGFTFQHPQVAFTPSFALRATAPEPLAGETMYVLHFDGPDQADVVWSGEAGTGEMVEAAVPVTPAHLGRLGRGDPLRFTAVRHNAEEEGAGDVVFSVEFTPLGQAAATQALMGYMADGLSTDLAQLVPPSEP